MLLGRWVAFDDDDGLVVVLCFPPRVTVLPAVTVSDINCCCAYSALASGLLPLLPLLLIVAVLTVAVSSDSTLFCRPFRRCWQFPRFYFESGDFFSSETGCNQLAKGLVAHGLAKTSPSCEGDDASSTVSGLGWVSFFRRSQAQWRLPSR